MILDGFKLYFWDFDGVIKDSVDVKTHAYFSLFESFGLDVAQKVREHHIANGGMSRFDKLPIYLEWAGVEPIEIVVNEFCEKFSKMVLQGVIDSPWVAGVETLLRSNAQSKIFVLVSATPQDELEYILKALNLIEYFSRVYGAPIPKQEAIFKTIQDLDLEPAECLMIGDAIADLKAADSNKVPFLLRKHASNAEVFSSYEGLSVEDFVQL
jgi:phosphoglycolate phosphatase-like HAD superfamily hydrolase